MTEPRLLVVRNEVDPDCEYHCDALASYFPGAEEVDYPNERARSPDGADGVVLDGVDDVSLDDVDGIPLGSVDGVVLTGSTAGVYERDERPWIVDQEALVRELIERRIPTLGVCFGHQVVNAALGGTVEHVGTTSGLVELDLDDDPIFEGVSPIVPLVHGDFVTEIGEGMEVIASAEYYHALATRHREAPVWTVQFHPEFTADLRERIEADFGWSDNGHDYDEVSATRVFDNFRSIVETYRTNPVELGYR